MGHGVLLDLLSTPEVDSIGAVAKLSFNPTGGPDLEICSRVTGFALS